MNPKFWGPHAWIFLHSITMNYPINPSENDKGIYKNFFHSLQFILPCQKCAYNYKRHLDEYPIDQALDSRESLIQWLINIHNEVNKELGYEQLTLAESLEKYYKNYECLDKKDTRNKLKLQQYCYFALILILIIVCINFYRKS